MKNLPGFAISALALNFVVGCGDNSVEAPIDYPSSCEEAAVGSTRLADGHRTLYLGNDVTKPWTAFCVDLDSDEPKEYLSLKDDMTWSSYSVTTPAGDSVEVKTTYDKVRIDPVTLELDAGDQTFALSSGTATHPTLGEISSMPLGVAMACNAYANAQLYLEGPFVIDQVFAIGGTGATGYMNPWASNQVIELGANSADCGWVAPEKAPQEPRNDMGGFSIKLRYE